MVLSPVQLNQIDWCFFQLGRLPKILACLAVDVRLTCLTCGLVFYSESYEMVANELCLHPSHDTELHFHPIWRRMVAPWFHWLDVSPDTYSFADRGIYGQ